MDSQRQPSSEAIIVRRFHHPVNRVYRAWTEPVHIVQWLRPDLQISLEVEHFALREGDGFYFRYTRNGQLFPVAGQFLTIDPQRTLIFTWVPQPPDPDAGKSTMVSVWFRSLEDELTEVEVRHTLFPDESMRRRHNDGWCGAVANLERYLGAAW